MKLKKKAKAVAKFNDIGMFKCLRESCGNIFRMEPGAHVRCPTCGEIYNEWLDYSRFEAERQKQDDPAPRRKTKP